MMESCISDLVVCPHVTSISSERTSSLLTSDLLSIHEGYYNTYFHSEMQLHCLLCGGGACFHSRHIWPRAFLPSLLIIQQLVVFFFPSASGCSYVDSSLRNSYFFFLISYLLFSLCVCVFSFFSFFFKLELHNLLGKLICIPETNVSIPLNSALCLSSHILMVGELGEKIQEKVSRALEAKCVEKHMPALCRGLVNVVPLLL